MTGLALLLLFWPLISWLIENSKARAHATADSSCFRRESVSGVRLR